MFTALKSFSSTSKNEDSTISKTDRLSRRRSLANVGRTPSSKNALPRSAPPVGISRRQSSFSSDDLSLAEMNEASPVGLEQVRQFSKIASKIRNAEDKSHSSNGSSKENITERMFVFRTVAEEKEIYHRTQQLMDQAISQIEDVLFEQYMDHTIEKLLPEQRVVLTAEHERKMSRLSSRLSMAVVAEPEELLSHRSESFLLVRGPTSTSNSSAPTDSASEEPALLKIDFAVYSSGQGVVLQTMGLGGAKVNPLVSPRGRKSSTQTTQVVTQQV